MGYAAKRNGDFRAELRKATQSLHEAAGTLDCLGLLSATERREYKRLLKAGASHKVSPRSPDSEDRAAWLIRKYGELELEYRERAAAKDPDRTPHRKRRSKRRQSDSKYSTLDRQQVFQQEHDSGRGERIKELTDRLRVAELIEDHGLTANQALEAADITHRTDRWARKWAARYREGGAGAMEDRRIHNGGDRTKSTSEVRKIIMAVQKQYPAARGRALTRKVREICLERGLPQPSESTVKAVLRGLPDGVLASLRGERDTVRKRHRLVRTTERAEFGSHRWQADHSTLDIWVRQEVNGEWVPAPVYMTVALDSYSRAIAGYFLSSAYPDAHSVGLMLHHACRRKEHPGWFVHGAPYVLQVDNGADWISNDVRGLCAALGTELDIDPPNYPDAKGKIERFFLTLDVGRLRTLPGHKRAFCRSEEAALKRVETLLTLQELQEEIDTWIAEVYHLSTCRTTKEKPIDRWNASARPKKVTDEGLLRMVLTRTTSSVRISNRGIEAPKALGGGVYLASDMSTLIGRLVVLHYTPDDLREVAVYCQETGEFLCTAGRMGSGKEPGIEEVKAARKLPGASIRSVVKPYVDQVAERDRAKAKKVIPEPAAPELELDSAEPDADDLISVEEDQEAQELLRRYFEDFETKGGA